MEDAFASNPEDAACVESPTFTAEDANRMLQTQREILVAKTSGLHSAMSLLSICALPVIASSATSAEIAKGVAHSKSSGRLTEMIDRARVLALQLAGHCGVSSAGRREGHTHSARSSAEVLENQSRQTSLKFGGILAGSAAASVTVSLYSEPCKAVAAGIAELSSERILILESAARPSTKRVRVDAAVSADSPSAPELLSRLAALERRLARRDRTIDEHASKMEAARAEGLIEGTRVGARAAYADSAGRLREVASSTWHTDNKPVRDALRSVATRLVKLANGDIE